MSVKLAPAPTLDVAEAKRDLDEFGYALLRDAINSEQIASMRDRLVEQAECEGKLEGSEMSDADQELTQSGVSMLLEKGETFRQALNVTPVHEILNHLFSRSFAAPLPLNYVLSSVGGMVMRKGLRAQPLHSDQGFAPGYIPFPLVANVYLMLSDFSAENGATRLVPGSHRFPAPNMMDGELIFDVSGHPELGHTRVETAEAPAGTALIWEGRTWHGAGANESGERRICIGGFYCAPWVRQRENLPASLSDAVVDELSDDELRLCGFDTMLPGSTTGFGLLFPGHGRTNVSLTLEHTGELHH